MPFSFFLTFPTLPRFTKKDVDDCIIDEALAALCDAIRAAFFLSRSIRKGRELWLAFAADRAVIRMVGARLRYLGPDERSTLMLVDKAAGVLRPGPHRWVESTPGVTCRAGIAPRDALDLAASELPVQAIVSPAFVVGTGGGRPAITFPPGIPALAARGGILLAMALDGTPVAAWPRETPAPSHPEQLINAEVGIAFAGIPTLASRILALNVIEDNARVEST